jgi:hypothetical protein
MTGFFIGILAAAGFYFLLGHSRQYGIHPTWWQWVLTVLGVLYAAFTLAVIYGFLAEDTPQAAVVMGVVQGFPAIIWGILLWRFVFKKTTDT